MRQLVHSILIVFARALHSSVGVLGIIEPVDGVEGLDLVGSFVVKNNTSMDPRATDWYAAANGRTFFGITNHWGTYDFVAHNPSLPGWMDVRIYCER